MLHSDFEEGYSMTAASAHSVEEGLENEPCMLRKPTPK